MRSSLEVGWWRWSGGAGSGNGVRVSPVDEGKGAGTGEGGGEAGVWDFFFFLSFFFLKRAGVWDLGEGSSQLHFGKAIFKCSLGTHKNNYFGQDKSNIGNINRV